MSAPQPKRFPGLTLTASDHRKILKMKRTSTLRQRDWRRIRMLELLDDGWNLTQTGRALGTYPREVRRVGWRFLIGGLEMAMSDDTRPTPPRLLDHSEESALVAMVCSDPPDGCGRWSIRLIAEEAVKRGIVPKIGRETVRMVLQRHDLKPWRKKNVVRARNQR
jgi:putative transposase